MKSEVLLTQTTRNRKLDNHSDAVVHFFCKMDIEMLDLILDEKRTYQDMAKTEFITLLGIAFDKFIAKGDAELIAIPGCCNSCNCPNKDKQGYTFRGNNSEWEMDVIIETKKNTVTDIFECRDFKNDYEENSSSLKVRIDTNYLPI